MKFLRYLLLALIALCLVTFALANREMAPVRLLPEDLAILTGLQVMLAVPVWMILFAGLLVGLILGVIWEWTRERSHRSAAPREAPTRVAWPVSKGSRTGRRAADQEGASVTTMVQLDPETRHERKNEAVRIDRSRRFGGTVAQPSSSSAWCDPPMIKIPARNGRPHSSVNMRVRHAPKSCADCAIAT